jgi:predicted enzyme related to lactoylglutathione lyase
MQSSAAFITIMFGFRFSVQTGHRSDIWQSSECPLWRTQMLGPEMGNYVVVTTTELDNNGRPKTPGSINGGFFQKSSDKPDQYTSVVIAVDDIQQHMTKVKEAGGELLGDPMDIPGVGSYVSFHDTEGNRVAMLQPLPVMQVRPR